MTDQPDRISHLSSLVHECSDGSFDIELVSDLLRIASRSQFDTSRQQTQSDMSARITSYVEREFQETEGGQN